MEKVSQRRLFKGAAILGLVAGLSACGPNYSGEGNDFKVKGIVLDAGQRSLTVDVYKIEQENGDAHGWFEDGRIHQIHDNCNCSGGFWNDNKKVGEVYDFNGRVVQPSEVAVNTCVEFTGKIRAHHRGKAHPERPVYEVAQEIPCDINR